MVIKQLTATLIELTRPLALVVSNHLVVWSPQPFQTHCNNQVGLKLSPITRTTAKMRLVT